MSAGAPWSVKGIDPKAREVAKDLARRSGMTLGEWLNRVILEDDVPEDVTSEDHFADRAPRAFPEPPRPRLVSSGPGPRVDDLSRVAYALDRLTDRIEASETRTGLAISGVEHSVRQAVARIDSAEREHVAVAARFEGAVDRVGSDQARLAERLRRMEAETSGPRSVEAIRALEQAVGRVANQVYEGESRTLEAVTSLEARVQRAEAFAGGNPAQLIDEVVGRLGQRLADAEGRTADALESLRGSFATLDGRLHSVEDGGVSDIERRFEELAAGLTQRVEDARAQIAEKLKATSAGRVDERFAELAAQVQAAERRSAQAIERMGREVLSMAEILNRRVQVSEQRSAEAIAQVGGEMARIATAVESRMGRAEQMQAEVLGKLGAEIGKMTERMLVSERRAAQAIDDVGEQVARVTERIEQRHERASGDIAERIRQSEERTARLLEEARDRIEQRIGEGPNRPAAPPPPPPSTAAFGPELFSRAESDDFEDATPPGPAQDFDAHDGFAPIAEAADEDIFGLEQPKPPVFSRVETDAQPLSTREVIEQARATARASAPAVAPTSRMQVKAKASWRAPPRPAGGLFGAAKVRRAPSSTLQTALMVAGGAAFLSVGAAGVFVMEGRPGVSLPDVAALSPIHMSPRAAIALAPQPLGPVAPVPNGAAVSASVPAPAPETLIGDYVRAVRGVETRQPGSLAELRAVAERGHAPAQFYLGKLYENGEHGVVQNMAEARRWTERAANGGDAAAMHNLALYYFRGEGGPQDLASATRWFRDAAERGIVDSQYNLGLLYQSGSGVQRDLAEAYKWFSIAAVGGDAQARSSAVALEAKLTPDVLASADRAASGFRPLGERTAQAAAPIPATTVAAAQRILGRLGYYTGASNGAASPQLKVAVAAYQRDQGLAATGSLDRNTVSRLSVFTR
jgi:localization factor PodJL